MIIALVGIDGSGKTTQIDILKEKLMDMENVEFIKAKPINRNLVEKNKFLFDDYCSFKNALKMAMTFDFLQEYNKMDKFEKVYIWDRYSYCIDAYFLAENINDINSITLLEGVRNPDILFWLRTSPEIAEKRILQRGEAKSLETASFLETVDKCYEKVLENINKVVIECSTLSIEDVSMIIWEKIKAMILVD